MAQKLGEEFMDAIIPTGTQPNAGKWTATFTPADMGIMLPLFDCYHIVIENGPPGSTFKVYKNNSLYDNVANGDTNSWDPNIPMKLENGDSVSFQWNTGTGTGGPTVWMYFQEPELL
jgi:hypothetical protein